MILFIILLFLTGYMILTWCAKDKRISIRLIVSLPIGISFHTLIFLFLFAFRIYYFKWVFILISLSFLLLFVSSKFRNKFKKIENDLKDYPIYFIVLVIFVFIRLLMMVMTGFFQYYHWDEMSVYQYVSKVMLLESNPTYLTYYHAPMNYFVGTMTYQFTGIELVFPRIIVVIFYTLIPLFLFKGMRNFKVNKHIASLISLLFLVSSSEFIIISKTFYNNVFFSFYALVGVYLLLKHFYLENKKNIPWLSYLIFLSTLLIRNESIYFVIGFILFLNIMLLIQKKITWKNSTIMVMTPILFYGLYSIFLQVHMNPTLSKASGIDILENIAIKFQNQSYISFFKNVWIQTFANTPYFFNGMIFLVFILCIIIVFFKLKKWKKENIIPFATLAIIAQLIYIAIITMTEIVLMSDSEFKIAASFSRYVITILPISYILIGVLLFKNTEMDKINMNKKEIIPILNPKILLIIPAYNEEKNILNTYNNIIEYNKQNKIKYDCIIINDGSTDKTQEICDQNHIPTIQLVYNLGIGGAVQTGYKYASINNYDIAIQFDGDGQHDVNYVKNIIEPIVKGQAHMVIGSRFLEKSESAFQSTRSRRIGIQLISWMMRLVTHEIIKDTTSGFRASNREVIDSFCKEYPTEYPEPISSVDVLKSGYSIKEVPVEMKERQGGVSSITSWKKAYYMINVFISIAIIGLRGDK